MILSSLFFVLSFLYILPDMLARTNTINFSKTTGLLRLLLRSYLLPNLLLSPHLTHPSNTFFAIFNLFCCLLTPTFPPQGWEPFGYILKGGNSNNYSTLEKLFSEYLTILLRITLPPFKINLKMLFINPHSFFCHTHIMLFLNCTFALLQLP